ncbi:MAG: hypothetical protein ACI9WC_002600 [Arenicella sp.]|jgi:hypothetical protein
MKYLLLVIVFFIQGCATFTPVPEGYAGPLVTIEDTSNIVSNTKVQFFELVKVDARNVSSSSYETRVLNEGSGISMTPVISKRQVPALKSTLSIQGVTYFAAPILAIGGGNFNVKGDVDMELKEDETYSVRGELSKTYSAVWVEDSKGNVVSQKIEKRKK